MNKASLSFIGLVCATVLMAGKISAAEAAPRDWENPQLTGINNELPHATMVICPSARIARKIGTVQNSERVKSPFYR
ncbi:MAG TPA: hypothetical protein VL863_08335, partial [bacterium]|nr:hypothetical protein [bacterium]